MDVTFLQKNYIVVLIAIILAIVLTSILNLVQKSPDENQFIKTSFIVGLISGLVVYIHTLDIPAEIINMEPPPF